VSNQQLPRPQNVGLEEQQLANIKPLMKCHKTKRNKVFVVAATSIIEQRATRIPVSLTL